MQAFSVSRQTISNWVDQGMPKTKENQFDLVACFQWRVRTLEERWESSKGHARLEEEEARYKSIVADLKDLELARQRELLIPIELVKAEWDRLVSGTKTQFLALPTRLAAKLPAPADTKVRVKEIAESEIKHILNELSNSDGSPNTGRQSRRHDEGPPDSLGEAHRASAPNDGKPVGGRKKVHPSGRKPRVARKMVNVKG
jgi:phage terminase Nu1 subunit (DNA packaging protein)